MDKVIIYQVEEKYEESSNFRPVEEQRKECLCSRLCSYVSMGYFRKALGKPTYQIEIDSPKY